MNSIIGLIILFLTILIMDKIMGWYKLRFERIRTQLDVLKVVSKHECFGKFKDSAQFERWTAKLLALKGFRIVEIMQSHKDSGKDMIVRNEFGQVVYVECKLADPENWDTPVDCTVARKLVGAMVGDGIKNGLIITTSIFSEEAKDYLHKVNHAGFQVKYLEGDALIREIYDLREVKLPEILENLGIKLRK
ncbi:MAG: restriction endonuclease [Peptococcaceae bacterium]|nr:restriction endonuclease [Peptococcaceae bacterium]